MTDTTEPISFPPTYVITLVHGTILFGILGKDPKWIKEGSYLRQTLTKTLPGSVLFAPFVWSGGNSAGSRQIASKELSAALVRQRKTYPYARHYVIAHSHGGNVTMYALRDSELERQIDGVVCLSTPFLHANKRNFGRSDEENVIRYPLMALLMGLIIFASVMIMLIIQLIVQPHDNFRLLIGVILFLCIFVLPGPLTDLLYTRLERMASELIKAMELAGIVKEKKLLIIRTAGDEATLGLIASQWASWLAGKWTQAVVNFRMLLQWIPFAWLADIPVTLPALFGVPSMMLACLVFGRELGLCSILLEINAETAPPGARSIHYLHPKIQPTGDSSRIFQLSHSSAYDDEQALCLIRKWIVAQQEE